MDVKRDPAILRRRKIRQIALIAVLAIGAAFITVAVSRLKPAAPTVAGSTVWFGTVKRGSFTREIRGAGTLVPEDIRWITATTSGRVEKIVLRPGATVKPGTVILELSNPDLRNQVNSAEHAWRSAVAQLENQKAGLKTNRVKLDNDVEDATAALAVAQADLEANRQLQKQGIVADLTLKQKQLAVDTAKNRVSLAEKTRQGAIDTEKSQSAPQEAAANQARAQLDQLRRQQADLQVKSMMSGQLQQVDVQLGQQVGAGANLVRVSDPTKLKAEIRISETQTSDLSIGLSAKVDTRNGIVSGRVTRIDPASVGGTVGVDVSLDEALPQGARPDQSVDGVIELQKLENVLYVESPAFGQENSKVSLFKMQPNGEAIRTQVTLGRRSVQFVEVIEGMQVGDRVILSDMSQYEAFDRVRVN